MFRTSFLSVIRSLVLYTPIAVYTVLDSWWWTENLFEICRVLFQK